MASHWCRHFPYKMCQDSGCVVSSPASAHTLIIRHLPQIKHYMHQSWQAVTIDSWCDTGDWCRQAYYISRQLISCLLTMRWSYFKRREMASDRRPALWASNPRLTMLSYVIALLLCDKSWCYYFWRPQKRRLLRWYDGFAGENKEASILKH